MAREGWWEGGKNLEDGGCWVMGVIGLDEADTHGDEAREGGREGGHIPSRRGCGSRG